MSSHFNTRRALPMTGLFAGIMLASSAQAGSPALDVVVFQGLSNSPPGFPGLFWNLSGGFSNPVIDNSGKIAFVSTIFGDGIIATNNRVMWYGDDSNWSIVARASNPTPPGLPGLTLSNISTSFPALAPNGSIVVAATVAGAGVTTATDTAFWSGPTSALGLVARESTTVAPGADGAVLSSSFGSLGVANAIIANNAGQVFFSSNLSGGTPAVTTANNFGTYVGSSSGTITEVVRKGTLLTGIPALASSSLTPDAFGFRMNGNGEVAHTGTLVGGGVTTANDKVLYTTVGGTLRIVAREGDAAPGGNYGTSFTIPTMMITNGGKILFSSTVGGVATWFVDDHGTVTKVIAPGDLIAGESLSSVSGMFLNNNDRLLIVGAAGAGGRIWSGPLAGPFVKVVEQSVTTVPGQGDVILNFTAASASAAFNTAGQCVFASALTGNVVPAQDDLAIFAWDPTDGLVMVARTGPGVIAELLDVTSYTLIGGTGITGENGSPIFTDNGWLTFRAQDVKGFQAIVRTQPFITQDCPADVNGDNSVGVADLLAVISAWGACPDPNNCPADLNNDDVVGVADLLAVISAWGACP